MMTQIVITRNQFYKLQEVFELYELDRVIWTENSASGIGPSVMIEFDPKQSIKMDITDTESW